MNFLNPKGGKSFQCNPLKKSNCKENNGGLPSSSCVSVITPSHIYDPKYTIRRMVVAFPQSLNHVNVIIPSHVCEPKLIPFALTTYIV